MVPLRRLPARDVGTAIVMCRVSSGAISVHLEKISEQVGTSAHALLVCDDAGWHQIGVRLRVPENVWEHLRSNQFSMPV